MYIFVYLISLREYSSPFCVHPQTPSLLGYFPLVLNLEFLIFLSIIKWKHILRGAEKTRLNVGFKCLLNIYKSKFFHCFSATLWLKHVVCWLVHGQGCGCEIHTYCQANVYLADDGKRSTFSRMPHEVRTSD